MSLLSHNLVARSLVAHLELKNDLVRIESMCGAKHLDCHDFFHLLTLLANNSFVVLSNLEVSLMRQIGLDHDLVAVLGNASLRRVSTCRSRLLSCFGN